MGVIKVPLIMCCSFLSGPCNDTPLYTTTVHSSVFDGPFLKWNLEAHLVKPVFVGCAWATWQIISWTEKWNLRKSQRSTTSWSIRKCPEIPNFGKISQEGKFFSSELHKRFSLGLRVLWKLSEFLPKAGLLFQQASKPNQMRARK